MDLQGDNEFTQVQVENFVQSHRLYGEYDATDHILVHAPPEGS